MSYLLGSRFLRFIILCALAVPLVSCGVKLDESDAQVVMKKVYEARKRGSFYQEFKLYAKSEFEIVPFEEVSSTLQSIVGGAGRFKSVKHVRTKISRRNQLSKGLVKYMVLTYHVTYSKLTLEESYYFIGESEKPKLVYLTLLYP